MDDKPVCRIEPRPENWPASLSGQTNGGETLWSVQYGQIITETGGPVPMSILIRNSVYLAVLSNQFKVAPESHYRKTLVLRDARNNQLIPPADPGWIY